MSGKRENYVHDPDNIARTTIKETNIHNNRKGQMGGQTAQYVYDPNDTPITTIKETNIHNNRKGNLETITGAKGYVKDKDDILRTTMKETLVDKTRTGNTNGTHTTKQYVYDPNDIARTTIKETNIHNNRKGNMESSTTQAGYVKDKSDKARTTLKETVIDNNRQSNVGTISGGGGGYENTNTNAPNTNRQFSSIDYYGNSNKEGGSDGYLVNKKTAPTTNRQFSTDYSGGADSINSKPRSYQDIYNSTINTTKEGTLVGRSPTVNNIKIANGADTINMEHKNTVEDSINTRGLTADKIYNPTARIDECQVTTFKDQLDNKQLSDRINPQLLDSFNKNPYSQSLQSYKFN